MGNFIGQRVKLSQEAAGFSDVSPNRLWRITEIYSREGAADLLTLIGEDGSGRLIVVANATIAFDLYPRGADTPEFTIGDAYGYTQSPEQSALAERCARGWDGLGQVIAEHLADN